MDIDHIRERCSSGISVDEGWRPLLITLDAAFYLDYITAEELAEVRAAVNPPAE